MCGLFGVANKGALTLTELSFIYQAMATGVVRGSDGFGLMAVDRKRENMGAIKCAGAPYVMYGDPQFRTFTDWMDKEASIVVGHHRAATKGGVSDQTAHPFTHGHITMVHNGTLTSGVDLTKFPVDSEGICAAIAEKGIKAFETIHGAYVCIWWDNNDKVLHLFKNGERPLSVVQFRSSLFWASEFGMLDWLLRRNFSNIYDKEITSFNIKKDVEYFIGKDNVLREAAEPVKKIYAPTTGTSGHAGASGWGPQSTASKWMSRQEKRELKKLRRQRAKADDKSANFFLFEEIALTGANGKTNYRYTGWTDRNEPVFVDCPHKLDYGWNAISWDGIISGPPRYHVVDGVTPNTPTYEIDYDTMCNDDDVYAEEQGKYHPSAVQTFYYTLNNRTVNNFNMKSLTSRGCAICDTVIQEKDVNNCLGLTIGNMTSSVAELICPVCAREEVKLS